MSPRLPPRRRTTGPSCCNGWRFGLERGSRLWTAARKKDSLTRVLGGSRSDAQRLHERVGHLLAAWEAETDEPGVDTLPGALDEPHAVGRDAGEARRKHRRAGPALAAAGAPARDWNTLVQSLEGTVRAALPEGEARAAELAHELMTLSQQVADGRRHARAGAPGPTSCACARAACWRTASICSTSWASCALS